MQCDSGDVLAEMNPGRLNPPKVVSVELMPIFTNSSRVEQNFFGTIDCSVEMHVPVLADINSAKTSTQIGEGKVYVLVYRIHILSLAIGVN